MDVIRSDKVGRTQLEGGEATEKGDNGMNSLIVT